MSSGQGQPGAQENGRSHIASNEAHKQAPKTRTTVQRLLGGLNHIVPIPFHAKDKLEMSKMPKEKDIRE
ncbi:MAG TPA: hypothetical protein VEW42_05540 [Candidatus Eisenbacteria bacterium]|nr:hypothetical protein [Candidatus Eisenbacteria bacterium]